MNDESEHLDLTPDVAAPAAGFADGVVSVTGILGESTADGSVRMYLDAARATFYDIPKDAVRDRQRVDAADSPLRVACTVLHIEQGTRISVQRSSSRTIDEEFLAGDFTAPGSFRTLAWAAPSGMRRQAARYNTNPDDCYSSSPRGGGCTVYRICEI